MAAEIWRLINLNSKINYKNKEDDIFILALESSCDETAASVTKNGLEVLSNVVSSQVELHKKFGGVVPEIASRKHLELFTAGN